MSGPIASPATGCCLPINTFCRPRLPRSGAERAAEGAQPLEAGQVELPVLLVLRALAVLPVPPVLRVDLRALPVPLVLQVYLVLPALPLLRARQEGQAEAMEAVEALVGRCSRCLMPA